MHFALRNRRCISLELNEALGAGRNLAISERTVKKKFSEGGFDIRRPTIEPLLSKKHRITRLRFAREHVNCTIDDWKRVLFSDETRVNLNLPDFTVSEEPILWWINNVLPRNLFRWSYEFGFYTGEIHECTFLCRKHHKITCDAICPIIQNNAWPHVAREILPSIRGY